MANLHIILNKDDDEGVINFLSEKYNVVKHDTSFKNAIESIKTGKISAEIIWVSEYAERGDKELTEAIKELRDNISETTRIIVILGEKRKNETELINQLDYLDIDYYVVDRYSASELKIWIETAKSKLPFLVWIAEENEEKEESIINSVHEFVFKKYGITNKFKDQTSLLKELTTTYPDVIALGYIQGKHDTEELIEEIKRITEGKVRIVALMDEEDKDYEKRLKKKDVDVYLMKLDSKTILEFNRSKTDRNNEDLNVRNIELKKNSYLKDIQQVQIKEKITINKQRAFKKTITIGVGSANNGGGSTHTSLAIANFLSRKGYSVAVAESNNNPILKVLYESGYKINNKCFEYNNFHIYIQDSNKNNINKLFSNIDNSKEYDYIIVDLGLLKQKNENDIMQPNLSYYEMFRVDYQILCLNGALWKWGEINFYRCDDLAEVEPNIAKWNLLISSTDSEIFKMIKSEIKNITVLKRIVKAPNYVNPFIQNEEVTDYLRQILYPILRYTDNEIKKKSLVSPLSIFNRS